MSKRNQKKKAVQAKQSFSPAVIIAIVVAVLAVAAIVIAAVFLAKETPSQPAPAGTSEIPSGTSLTASEDTSVPPETSYLETSFEAKEEYEYVQIEMADGGKIVVELYPDVAPITVANFVKLAKSGFYDGLIFHRVISGFMIQGGDPLGTGTGGSGENIKGEFSANGVVNNLSHKRGVISMARASKSMDSASSQFFIMHKDDLSLDGSYAAFGRVVSGMDVVDKIASVQTNPVNDKPLTDQVMKKVTVLE